MPGKLQNRGMLRTVFVLAIVLIGIRYSFRGAFYVLLFYMWYAYFRPESWVWYADPINALNISLIVGIILVLASIGHLRKFKWTSGTVLVALFFVQSLISLLASEDQTWSFPWWLDFAKSLIVSLLITVLVEDAAQFRKVLVIIALSLGFEATKQGWAQMILNPGATNNNPMVMLGDNNGVAVGMMMLLPIVVALLQTSKNVYEKYIYRIFIVGVLYRGLSTYSRGGLLAAVAVGLIMFWYSPRKIRFVVVAAALTVTVLSVMPPKFFERMQTITETEDSQRDEMSEGRITMWQTAVRMANAKPITGVGFNGFSHSFDRYDISRGAYGSSRAAHSAWFGVLAELGYPGFFLFIGTIGRALWLTWRIRRKTRRQPEFQDFRFLASGLLASLVAFGVGMTFLSGQYLELLWHVVGLTIALELVYRKATHEQPAVAVSALAARADLGGYALPGRLAASGSSGRSQRSTS